MTLTWGIFYLLSVFTILSGVLTIVLGKNPINSVVYLVSCFVNCALIFILMGQSSLIGFIYIIVYVGAIAILFIFVIMMMDLTEVTYETDSTINDSHGKNIGFSSLMFPPAIILALTVLYFYVNPSSVGFSFCMTDFTTWEIAQTNYWDSLIQGSGSSGLLHSIGYLLYTDFLSLLLLASLILLMVMIAVIALVKDQKST